MTARILLAVGAFLALVACYSLASPKILVDIQYHDTYFVFASSQFFGGFALYYILIGLLIHYRVIRISWGPLADWLYVLISLSPIIIVYFHRNPIWAFLTFFIAQCLLFLHPYLYHPATQSNEDILDDELD